uniref:Pentatricopeptide repeat-containing protein n=1 Tax=Ananas comosus var. bracteatus TaxID=296719 RepID=A0A6V7P3L0_ANACO|nr:unnamed protein product [Ananas comosus var. bracteatus]
MLSSPSLPLPLFQIHHPSPLPSPQSPPFASKEAPKRPLHNAPHKRTLKSRSFPSQNPSFSTKPEALPPLRRTQKRILLAPFGFEGMTSNRSPPISSPAPVSSRFRELWDARKVFDGMPERNVVSWTAVLNGFLNMGLDDEVLVLFKEMVVSDVEANGLTFVCLLKYCGNRFDVDLGKQVHACVVKGRWSNLIVDSALVYFYSRCGDLLGAFKVFDKMPGKDVVCWTTMITAYVQHGLVDEAFSMFSSMQYHGFCPNEYTVCSVLKACGEARDLRLGKQLHGAVAKGLFKQDVYVGSSLVNIENSRINARERCCLMDGHDFGIQQSRIRSEALKLLNDMLWDNVKPNMFTYSSALKACARLENANYGKWIHACVSKAKALENVFVGSSLIDMYMRCRDVADALRVFDEMPDRNSVTWKVMVIGYAKNGRCKEALKLMYRMQEEGFDVDSFVLATVLSACGDVQWESERASTCCLISGCVNETRK